MLLPHIWGLAFVTCCIRADIAKASRRLRSSVTPLRRPLTLWLLRLVFSSAMGHSFLMNTVPALRHEPRGYHSLVPMQTAIPVAHGAAQRVGIAGTLAGRMAFRSPAAVGKKPLVPGPSLPKGANGGGRTRSVSPRRREGTPEKGGFR